MKEKPTNKIVPLQGWFCMNCRTWTIGSVPGENCVTCTGTSAVFKVETTGPDPVLNKIVAWGLWETGKKAPELRIGKESELLKDLWSVLGKTDVIVGFNVDFDWNFIKVRSLKYGYDLVKFPRYRGPRKRVDLRMILNSSRRAYGNLRDYAKLFGFEFKSKYNTRDIPDLWRKKKYSAILQHLKTDLLLTRKTWHLVNKSGLVRDAHTMSEIG